MKLKLIAAALALAAAGSANAAIDKAVSGNGELFAVVASKSLGYSFVADLGVKIDDFNTAPAANYMVDMSTYGQWASFNAAVAGATDLKFAVIGLDSTGTGAGLKRMYTTYAPGATVTNTTSGNFQTAVTNYDGWITNLTLPGSNAGTDMTSAVANNGSAYSDSSFTTTYFFGSNASSSLEAAKGKLAFSVLVNAGERANFGLVATASSPALKATLNELTTADQYYWTLNGADLTYVAAVPEPETYALMLAGLGLVGFVARRRKAA